MTPIDSSTILPVIDINFRVSAGPGAGKTYWLVEHLKNVLLNSQRLGKAGKISCITYTNIGVETIRSRLGQSADQIEVSSIHSFLYAHVLRPYLTFVAEEYGINVKAVDGHTDTILSGYTFLARWKAETTQSRITDDTTIARAFKDMRWRFTATGELEVNTSYPHKFGNYAIKKASYYYYKKLAWEKGVLHHDDVLFISYQILVKFPFVINVLVTKFPYFFLDEFQDSNPIQVAIITLLGTHGAFIGIIGDVAQSIYGFQGAKPTQFLDFKLPGLVDYVISENRRSSNQIINVLNKVRNDIVQAPWRKSDLALPMILVGPTDGALKKAKLMCAPETVHSLSRDNITSNIMKRELCAGVYDSSLIALLMGADSNSERRDFIIASIKSVELAKQNNFRDAIKELRKGMRKIPSFAQVDKLAISLIMVLLKDYQIFSTMSLLEFSAYIKSNFVPGASKVTGGKAKAFYEKTSYQDLAICVHIGEDMSLHKTIHKAKGDEFDNVLVLLSDSAKFDFVLAPDLLSDSEKSEEQRVNYVAISRARNRLFICVPELSLINRDALKNSFIIENI
jgi:DNA helicase II / ATP-dependent DNA helicase PcrA